MAYLGLARKYRPQRFEDLVGQEVVVRVLKNALQTGKISHAYVFSGPKGVGKTSTARILAKALNCLDPQNRPCDSCLSCASIKEGRAMSVIEIDAASHTSVENIRELRENVRYASAEGTYKVYIIDEAHMLSQAAFNAFLKTLEEPPPHVVFVLATTEPRKIPITVLSRCQHLQFRRIPQEVIYERLKHICRSEGIGATDEALELIAQNSEGSMRDALTLLDQVSSFSDSITVEDVKLLLGATDYRTLLELAEMVIGGEKKGLIEKIEELNSRGTDFKVLIRDLIFFFRDFLVQRVSGEPLRKAEPSYGKTLERLSQRTSDEHLLVLLRELINAESSIKHSLFPRIIFEVTLLRLSMLSYLADIDRKISSIKRQQQAVIENREFKDESKIESSSCEVGSPSSEELSQGWARFLEKLESEKPLLLSKLSKAEVSFREGKVVLCFNGGAHVFAESIRSSLSELEETLNEFVKGAKIVITEKEAVRKDFMAEALRNPVVKETLELFDGRIYKITPKRGGGDVKENAR